MNRWCSCCLFGALAVPCGTEPESIVFAPRAGTTIVKDYEEKLTLAFGGATMLFQLGRDRPFPDDVHARGEHVEERRLRFADTYHRLDGSRPLETSRSFSAIDVSERHEDDLWGRGQGRNLRYTESGALEGLTVRFAWNEASARHDVTFDPQPLDDEALRVLGADWDLVLFLPDREVEPGASWTVPAVAAGRLLEPGGAAKLPAPRPARNPLHSFAAAEWTGDVEARFVEVLEVDGIRLARISIELEVEARERLEPVETILPIPFIASSGRVIASEHVRLVGEGELVWQLDDACMESLDLQAAVQWTHLEEGESEPPGISTTLTQDWSGELAVDFSARRSADRP